MPTEVIGMWMSITGGTENAGAAIDIPKDGVITGIDVDVHANMDADSEYVSGELSFIATNQLNSNDVRGRLTSWGSEMSLTTSGIATTTVSKFLGFLDIPVSGGERLYLHSDASAGVTGNVRVNVHLDSARTTPRRSARR